MPNFALRATVLLLAAVALTAGRAAAIPVFAARYDVSCQTCHSIVPRLNGFGEAFRAAGYRWPAKVATHAVLPVSVKVNLAYTSQSDPSGLPKAIVDEVELLSFGPAGNHFDYRVEQYVVDGGMPGATRDAYVAYSSDPMRSWTGSKRLAFDVQAGQFTLPLPDDPETQRPTETHYAIYDQTVGTNPFNFFDDRDGFNAGITAGNAELRALALHGDTMFAARIGPPQLSFDAYHYRGSRLLTFGNDAFVRSGFALTSLSGKARTSLLVQTGSDSNTGDGSGALSSGGYVQEEWGFSSRLIGVVRYDRASGPADLECYMTMSLSYRPVSRARLTLEETTQYAPVRSSVLNAAALFAF